MNNNLFNLQGKVALVTGGNGGLGFGFARGIAKCGGDLVIWGRDSEKNKAAVTELSAFGGRVQAKVVDVTDDAAVAEGMQSAIDSMGRLDCVVANAGMTMPNRSLLDLTTEDYLSLLEVNQHGGFFTLREAARQMVKRVEAGDPGGSLIVCGSLSVFCGAQGMAHYGASKSAMAAMMKTAAVELGQYGIRANMVALGLVNTELLRHELGTDMVTFIESEYAKGTPLQRVGSVEDVEGISAYLASDCSAYHSGDIILIDGGRLATI
ncbi:MAG: 2-deoxy-D-gluconate 3-dehydrogenase [Gammaproteobacteria bacterium]|nr:2-deoxy-D-gluconate 3-dehydrogenase [Gammaproteobacteria bacterium]